MTLRNLAFVASALRQVRDVPRCTHEELSGLQEKRLRKLLDFAREHSPFYRQRLAGLDTTHASLRSLPVVTKEDIRQHFDEVVTDRAVKWQALERFVSAEENLGKWLQGKYAIAHSSGSQGQPLFVVHDRDSLAKIIALMTARSSVEGVPSPWQGLRRLFRPQRITAISFRRGFHPSGMILEYLPVMLSPLVRLKRLPSQDPDLAEKLVESNPQVITGYPSVLEGLAIQHGPLRMPSLEYITTSSEQLLPRARQRIEDAFGVPVFNHYGTCECLHLADGCRYCGGVHVNSDWAILESVDDEGHPVPPETTGCRILITNLANKVQPMIRYEIGDRVAISSNGCGTANSLPRLISIEGRTADVLWFESQGVRRFVSGIIFQSAMDSLNQILDWRVLQTAENDLLVELQLLPGQHEIGSTLEQTVTIRLYDRGLPQFVSVTVSRVPSIPVDARTGKIRRIHPLSPAADADEGAGLRSQVLPIQQESKT